MTFRALLIAALKPEWNFIKKHTRFEKVPFAYPLYRFKNLPHAAVLQTGPGLERAEEATAAFLDAFGCERVLHIGTCGSLHSELAPCDVIAAFSVLDESGDPSRAIICDKSGQNRLLHALTQARTPCHQGNLVSVKRPAKNTEEKRALYLATKAKAVDMESHAVATLCRDKGIGYNVVRGVFDAHNEDIEAMGEPYNEGGNLSALKLAANLIKTPKMAFALPELKKRIDLIGERLTAAVDVFVS